MNSDGTKRIASVTIRRGRFFRKFYMYLLAALAGGGAIYALDQVAGQRSTRSLDKTCLTCVYCRLAALLR